ncbi:MAG: PilZ domain-containing protein [Proteobacteria bacterium]|nr:PilZ domain-containing protein [Pseudomonadota bacterium]MBU1583223.1 PilZ domain-containing protein [Pseudomonadota bacterium]MBU2454444.1 PilZ domain-containing protein [Pseudomonadota bacterium]MBU2631594.1 PilZ domain-containing protein [Pseudomonadota bacterium]
MFWKKKNPETDVIRNASDEQRKSYRYDFKDNEGFEIDFKEKKVWVLNISAGGIAFSNQGFKQFDFDFIKFTLDIPNFIGDSSFFAGLRILKIDKNDVCHCIFEQCSLEQHELIHKYVLEMQKHDLAH